MEFSKNQNQVGKPAKIGAILFMIWGVLHIWVGAEGVHQYLTGDIKNLWTMFIGGSNVPYGTFQYATESSTILTHKQLILNFCIDVGGYGVLGIVLGYLILKKASWIAYLMGVFVIGIADLAFLFAMVTSGVIVLNAGTVGGPLIWILAVIITPFGLPKLNKG